jgi:hypothetical protein
MKIMAVWQPPPLHIGGTQCLSYIVRIVQIKIDNIVKIRKLDEIIDSPSTGKHGGEKYVKRKKDQLYRGRQNGQRPY